MESNSYHTYPKIYNIGHKYLEELFFDEVTIEEKIDGSQFSWGRFNGELKCRSKGQQLNVDAPEKMFEKAVTEIKTMDLHDGWTYRAEYLNKPKHNALAYDRVPKHNLIIFDINTAEETYLNYTDKSAEAARLDLEVVPLIACGTVESVEEFKDLLETPSILGGQKVEGVVVKNYQRFGLDGKVLMGKFVSSAFREINSKEWKKEHPGNKDILQELIVRYKTPARWMKAIQHLREKGELEDSPKDIGKLLKEVSQDIQDECKEEIAEILFKWAWKQIARGFTAGLAEWYKNELLKRQFGEE
jgi:hypothetical protein